MSYDYFMKIQLIKYGKYENWRERAHMALCHLGYVLDACIFFASLTLLTTEFAATILLDPDLKEWTENA